MKDQDQEILDKADKWEKEKNKLSREKMNLKHERWMGFGGFIKMAVIYGGLGTLVLGGGYFGLESCAASCEAESIENAQNKEVEQERNLALKDVYDRVWIKCVNTMGLDECNLIKERSLFEQCPHYDGYKGKLICNGNHLFDERYKNISEGQ